MADCQLYVEEASYKQALRDKIMIYVPPELRLHIAGFLPLDVAVYGYWVLDIDPKAMLWELYEEGLDPEAILIQARKDHDLRSSFLGSVVQELDKYPSWRAEHHTISGKTVLKYSAYVPSYLLPIDRQAGYIPLVSGYEMAPSSSRLLSLLSDHNPVLEDDPHDLFDDDDVDLDRRTNHDRAIVIDDQHGARWSVKDLLRSKDPQGNDDRPEGKAKRSVGDLLRSKDQSDDHGGEVYRDLVRVAQLVPLEGRSWYVRRTNDAISTRKVSCPIPLAPSLRKSQSNQETRIMVETLRSHGRHPEILIAKRRLHRRELRDLMVTPSWPVFCWLEAHERWCIGEHNDDTWWLYFEPEGPRQELFDLMKRSGCDPEGTMISYHGDEIMIDDPKKQLITDLARLATILSRDELSIPKEYWRGEAEIRDFQL